MTLLTKSANVDRLLDLEHRGHSILSWSVNPPEVSATFEENVPSIDERLEAVGGAADRGYPRPCHHDADHTHRRLAGRLHRVHPPPSRDSSVSSSTSTELNQALSLFLGLAQATSDRQAFGFLMLDDPTQSMGSQMKRQFVSVPNDVVSWRKLVVATPDQELKEMLVKNIARNKALYEYVGWSETEGPSIEREA